MSRNIQNLPHPLDGPYWKETTKDSMQIFLWSPPEIEGNADTVYSGLFVLKNAGPYNMSDVEVKLVIDDMDRPWNPYFTNINGQPIHPSRPREGTYGVGDLNANLYYWDWFYYRLQSTGLRPTGRLNKLFLEMDTEFEIDFSAVAPLDKEIVTN